MGNRGGHFNVEAAPLLGMLAFLTVLALELKDKLLAKTELQAGRAVQRAMEPERTPFIPGYDVWLFTRPANEVGGDLVDFMRLDHDRYGIVIGDVSGKGLGAALLMVKIQATIRALAPDYTSPAAFLSKLNAILTRDHVPGSFTSLIFLNVSAASQAIRYVNAGHMPPLIISGTVVSESPKGDAALGLSGDTVYGENELLLRKGETVVLYSDGITEAQNDAGEFFGLDRFKALCAIGSDISAQAFGERIVGSVEGFIASARGTDDLSLVILRRSA